MACNIWLNLCIFLIGTDFWRFIPRDSLKLWSDKSVGGYRTLHTNAKSIYTIDIVVGSKNNAYIIKRIRPQQNIICSSGSLELDQQVCVSLPFLVLLPIAHLPPFQKHKMTCMKYSFLEFRNARNFTLGYNSI